MGDDGVESNRGTQRNENDYEPPAVFDFGAVFEVTHGSSGGSADQGGQKGD